MMALSGKCPQMDWKHEPLVDSFKAFQARMNLYLEDLGVTDETKQATKIKIALGDEGMRRILASGLTETEQKIPARVWTLIESEVDASVKINFRVHRLEFANMKQKTEETISQFLSRLREKATKCECETAELNERLIEMVILSTPHDEFRKELLTKVKGHPVSEVLERGREYEAIAASTVSLKSMSLHPTPTAQSTNTSVDAIRRRSNPTSQNTAQNRCSNCGLTHKKGSCPAYNDKCSACNAKGHWKMMCRRTSGGQTALTPSDKQTSNTQQAGHPTPGRGPRRRQYQQHDVSLDCESYGPEEFTTEFHAITISDVGITAAADSSDEAFITLRVRHIKPDVCGPLRIKVDTGSGGNTLPLRTYRQMFGDTPFSEVLRSDPDVRLTSYSGDPIKCFGSLTFDVRKESQHKAHQTKFYVVDVSGPAILGLPSCRQLEIVNLNLHAMAQAPDQKSLMRPILTIDQLQSAYPGSFDAIGKFKDPAHLHLKDDAVPFCDPPRKVSIHLKPQIKQEIDKMETEGVIRRVTEHSDWCSSLVYVTKPDGSLRICLDPKKLNGSLRRCPHRIPTLEELNPTFAGAQVFSKLDAKAGYWSIPLHEDSQMLTTFRTPFGRYCWTRLPFGLNVSQDIFQSRMDDMLEGLPGVASIADDIAVCGKTRSEHDDNLVRVMDRAAEYGLCMNSSKCAIAKPEITFFGNRYSKVGILPDPAKVKDLRKMATPESKEDVQRFLGLMTYLSPYIPHFANQSQPLRDLMKADVPFLWEADHQTCFEKLRIQVPLDKALAFYDTTKPLTLEVDASMKGLGAALTQEDRIIAFASKSLTQTQANYSNIEREALGLVFGIQRFHTYLFGRGFTAVTDHKPLVNIWEKPLISAPSRLQRMFLKLQGYSFRLMYKPGPEMTISDALSRLPNTSNRDEICLDTRVDGIYLDDLEAKPISLLNFAPNRLSQIREETTRDPALAHLKEVINLGWPNTIKECHPDIRQYYNYRECLAVEAGIITKGRQVIIPKPVQPEILRQLHISHQGIKKTQALARESVYWPGIHTQIENLIASCQTCQMHQPLQKPEETLHHDIPPQPWWKLASDMCQIGNKTFLIIVDYFTKYPLVIEMQATTSAAVAAHFKSVCALFGCPKVIVSDNGPPYVGPAMREFTRSWGILHVTSSPRYPRSNGLAERTVGTIKRLIKKCTESGGDLRLSLLHLRATPIDEKTVSPAELLFGRPIATDLPSRREPLPRHVEVQNHLTQRLVTTPGNSLSALYPNQPVRILDQASHTWLPGSVVHKSSEPRSYVVKTDSGSELRRNRSHIRTIPLPPSDVQETTHLEAAATATLTQPDCAATSPRTPERIMPQIYQPTKPITLTQGNACPEPSSTPRTGYTRSGRRIMMPQRYQE